MAFTPQQEFLSINLLNNSVAALINNNLGKPFANKPVVSKTDIPLKSEDNSTSNKENIAAQNSSKPNDNTSNAKLCIEIEHEHLNDEEQEKLRKLPVNQLIVQYLHIQKSLKEKTQEFCGLTEQYAHLRSEYNDFFLDTVEYIDEKQFPKKEQIQLENDRLKAENASLCNKVHELSMNCSLKINELESLVSEHNLIERQIDAQLQSSYHDKSLMAEKIIQLSDEVINFRENRAEEFDLKSKYGCLSDTNFEFKAKFEAAERVIKSQEEEINYLRLEIHRKNELLATAKSHFSLVENMEQKLIHLEERYSCQLSVKANINEKQDKYEDLLKEIRHAIHFTMMLLQEGVRMSDNLKQEIGDLRHQINAREICDKSINTVEYIVKIDKGINTDTLIKDGNDVSTITDLNGSEFVSNLSATNCKIDEEYSSLAAKFDTLSLEREKLKNDILSHSELYVKQELSLRLQTKEIGNELLLVTSTNESLKVQLQLRNKRLYSLQRKLFQSCVNKKLVLSRQKIRFQLKFKNICARNSKLNLINNKLRKQLVENDIQISRLTTKIATNAEEASIEIRLEMDKLLMENKSLKWLNSTLTNQLDQALIQNTEMSVLNEKEKIIDDLNDKLKSHKLVIQQNSELKTKKNGLTLDIQSLSKEIAEFREKEQEWMHRTDKFENKKIIDEEPNQINFLTKENNDLKEIIKTMQESIDLNQNAITTHRLPFMPNKECCEILQIYPNSRGNTDGYNIPELLRICRTIIARKGVFTLTTPELHVIHKAIYAAALGKESVQKAAHVQTHFADQQNNRVEQLESKLLESKKILRKLSKQNGDLNIIINTPINCSQSQNLNNLLGVQKVPRRALKKQ